MQPSKWGGSDRMGAVAQRRASRWFPWYPSGGRCSISGTSQTGDGPAPAARKAWDYGPRRYRWLIAVAASVRARTSSGATRALVPGTAATLLTSPAGSGRRLHGTAGEDDRPRRNRSDKGGT